jgi:hypothetical protein
MRNRALFALAGLIALGPASLVSQEGGVDRLRGTFSVEEVERIEAVIENAEGDGIPRSLLVAKAVEGAAKGMTPQVVLGAVSQLAAELRVARRLLGPDVDAYGLEKAADALRHGVSGGVVGTLAEEHPRDFPVMLQVIEDLLHEGVALGEAEAVVREAASRGYGGDHVLTLPGTVRRMIRGGASPAQAASSLRQNLRAGRPIIPPPGLGSQMNTRRPPLRGTRPPPGVTDPPES